MTYSKNIFIKFNMIISSFGRAVFSFIYKNYEYFILVETDYILMTT